MSDPFNKSSPQSLLCFPPRAPKPSYCGLKRGQQARWLILDLFHEKNGLLFKAISHNVQRRHGGRLCYTSGMNITTDFVSCLMAVYSESPYGDQQYHSLKLGLLRPLLLLEGCQDLIHPPPHLLIVHTSFSKPIVRLHLRPFQSWMKEGNQMEKKNKSIWINISSFTSLYSWWRFALESRLSWDNIVPLSWSYKSIITFLEYKIEIADHSMFW